MRARWRRRADSGHRGGRTAWLAVLRIARRDALRARWRSALVVALVALPIAAVTGGDIFLRTIDPEADVRLSRTLGKADARYEVVGGRVEQIPDGTSYYGGEGAQAADPLSLLPAGSRAISAREVAVSIQTRAGIQRTALQELDYADPLAEGMVEQLSGRPPERAGEAVITPKLREVGGLGIGDTLRLVGGERRFTVVGVARFPGALHAEEVLALPGALSSGVPGKGRGGESSDLLVDTPGPVTWDDVLAANRKGVAVRSRAVTLDPPPRERVPYYADASGSDDSVGAEGIALIVVIAGMAALEIVLLAGAAFAVGARRQSRSLALLAAAGGEMRDLRRTVLAGGLLLGLAGAALGIALGVAGAWLVLGLGLAEGSLSELPGSFDLRVVELAGIALFGALTGVLAALFPARGAARMDVVAALGGRRGALRTRKRQPLLGLALAVSGCTIAVLGALGGQDGAFVIVTGAVLAQVGLIVLTPAVVGAVGRSAHRLPIVPRLALRDASRHQARTTPAVAAIMTAVAGTIAVSVYVVSLDDRGKRDYSQVALEGQAHLTLENPEEVRLLGRIRGAVASELPVTQTTVVRTMAGGGMRWVVPAAQRCPAEGVVDPDFEGLKEDSRCADGVVAPPYVSPDAVGDASDLRKLTGVSSPAAKAALASGGAVFFDRRHVNGGRATAVLGRGEDRRRVSLPAVYAATPLKSTFKSIIAPATAQRLGLTPRTHGVVFSTSRVPTEREELRARTAIGRTGALPYVGIGLEVERGYVGEYGPGLLALIVASAIITLGAAGIATALAAAEGRPDQGTLAAVGAGPRVRKLLGMFQAATVAGLGTALGILAGLVPGAAVVVADPTMRFVIPWATLGAILLVVPLLAMLAALTLTRSRVALERRLA